MRARALAGEDLDLKPATRRDREFQDEDGVMDYNNNEEEEHEVRLRPRRAARRKVGSDNEDEAASAPRASKEWIAPKGNFVEKSVFCLVFERFCIAPDAAIARPGAPTVRLPTGSTRSFRNQLVRLDLCSFISSSVHPFCNLLMLGTEQNERFGSAVAAAAAASVNVRTPAENDLKTDEKIEDSSLAALQEKFILEESAAFFRKVLNAAEASLESQKILML